jgi:hypothetical protein
MSNAIERLRASSVPVSAMYGEQKLVDHQPSATPRILWHYTVGNFLNQILEDGLIRPTTLYVSPREKPCAWFTASSSWEETANKGIGAYRGSEFVSVGLDRELTHLLSGGLVRIGVLPEAAPHDWQAYKSFSGVPARTAKSLYQTAVAAGSRLSNWFVSFEPVPQSKWVCIQFWDGNQWCDDPAVRPPTPSTKEANRLIIDALEAGRARPMQAPRLSPVA